MHTFTYRQTNAYIHIQILITLYFLCVGILFPFLLSFSLFYNFLFYLFMFFNIQNEGALFCGSGSNKKKENNKFPLYFILWMRVCVCADIANNQGHINIFRDMYYSQGY